MSALPSMTGRALIAAGGTGGHVYPALAVAGLLTEQGWSVDWVGTERGIEQRLVPAAGLPLHHLSVSGLRGKNWVARAQGALRLVAALCQSLSLMWRVKPDVVLGMGGYAAGPAGLAAWLTRRPLVIHEQNSVAGTTNRWLAPLARRVLCGLPGGFAAGRGRSGGESGSADADAGRPRRAQTAGGLLCRASTQGVGVGRQPWCGTLERVTASRGRTVNGPGAGSIAVALATVRGTQSCRGRCRMDR